MRPKPSLALFLTVSLLLPCSSLPTAAQRSRGVPNSGFTRLFNGTDLSGWRLVGGHGPGYIVRNGLLICPADGGGNLFTEQEYADFILRFEFRLERNGNNGVGIRSPLEGNPAFDAMEIQILDDDAPQHANLQPAQYHGSVYGVVPAKRGALKKPGEWNYEEITAIGRRITVKLNGKVIVDADLNQVSDPGVLAEHPGLFREKGRIGFLGHGTTVEFRNIWIRDLTKPEQDNTPPKGFTALFNGRDLTGWKGLVADPPTRAKMTPDALTAAQQKADERMRAHWKVQGGILVFDGKGDNLCTEKDYGDFELVVDWKIKPGGDSGIYLRGSPQVQIWDRAEGSGGLYNNQKNPSDPTRKADNPPGAWNRFRIVMVGERVTVFLNDQLVVRNVVMENYWERDKPIYPTGAIELQNHGDELWFKNLYVREISR